MQCFAGAHAKLCVGECKALRGRMQSFASEMGKTGTEIISHILDISIIATHCLKKGDSCVQKATYDCQNARQTKYFCAKCCLIK